MTGISANDLKRLMEVEKENERLRAALETLADSKRWSESDTGRVTWLHLDGKTKPWEIAQAALTLATIAEWDPEHDDDFLDSILGESSSSHPKQ